jgi:hypothetical protein
MGRTDELPFMGSNAYVLPAGTWVEAYVDGASSWSPTHGS